MPFVVLRNQMLGAAEFSSVNQINPWLSRAKVAGIAPVSLIGSSLVTLFVSVLNSPILPAPNSVNQNVRLSSPGIIALGIEFGVGMDSL